jgi:hypothetical protein
MRCASQLSELRLGKVTFLEHHRPRSVLEVAEQVWQRGLEAVLPYVEGDE